MVDAVGRRLQSFRRCLLHLSDTLIEDEVERLKFHLRSRIPRKRLLKMPEGFYLFAYLEQKGVISPDDYRDELRKLLSVLGRDAEKGLANFESTPKSILPISLGGSADIPASVSTGPVPAVQELYAQCVDDIDDNLATEDGSLQRLVYVSACLPLKHMVSLQSGRAFVLELERVGAIACWKLQYLDMLFRIAGRHDLSHKLLSFTRHALVAMPTTLNYNASCNLPCTAHRSATPGSYVRSISEPARLQPTCLADHFSLTPMDTSSSSSSSHAPSMALPDTLSRYTLEDVIDGVTTSDSTTVDVFEHPVYVYLQHLFAFPGIYHVFVSIFLLTCIFSIGKLKLEWNHCGPGTAVLNFAAKVLTHNVLPFYVLSTLPGIVADAKVKSCALLTKPLGPETQGVMLSVLRKLSTPEEWNELSRLELLPVQKVSSLLRKKLTCVAMSSVAQSATFSFGIFVIIGANWSVFTGLSADTFARVNCFVLVFTSLVIHGMVTLSISIFLFEMRLCEYLAHMASVAYRKKAHSVSKGSRKLKKTLEMRWRGFRSVMTGFTLVYAVLLGSSALLQVPFRCSGGKKMDLSVEELVDVPSCWLCWVLVGFLGQLLVCWYRVFVHGRIVAVVMQLLFALVLLHQHSAAGQHLKWAGLLQIIHALYPVVYGLTIFHVRCCHAWIEYTTACSRVSHSSKTFMMPFSKFLANVCAFVLVGAVSAYAVSVEYDSFQSLHV